MLETRTSEDYILTACQSNTYDTSLIEQLISQRSININISDGNAKTCLHWAAINSIDHNGLTPLHDAVEANRKDAVNLLICAGADIEITDMHQ